MEIHSCVKHKASTANTNDKCFVRLCYHKGLSESNEFHAFAHSHSPPSFWNNFDVCRQVRPGVPLCPRHLLSDKLYLEQMKKYGVDDQCIKLVKSNKLLMDSSSESPCTSDDSLAKNQLTANNEDNVFKVLI